MHSVGGCMCKILMHIKGKKTSFHQITKEGGRVNVPFREKNFDPQHSCLGK